ncbi:YkvI family membrane protein [Bacillus rubiinfantis]|uniref:YkvI family membrane protein n=1 Tax=Bacillus rubiinfantis TaxID=1499680 RepID=UPI0005A8F461|nr:membrane protein [Bacillus rubiinfantis]
MRKSLQIAGAYVGIIVGAGFASGQEILQFFTSFGLMGIIGGVIATFFFAFLGMQLTQLGSKLQTDSHKDVIYHICGRYLGVLVDAVITFFLFGVTVVMMAGSGSIFEQQFGLPAMVGNIVMAVLTILTVCLNVQKLLSIISWITPYLMVLVVIITGYSLMTMDQSFSALEIVAKKQPAAASNWLLGGLLYVSYNIAAGAAMLAVMGGTEKNAKVAGRGGILGGLGLGLLILLINIGMFARLDTLQGVEMPTLLLANQLHPVLGALMSIALLGMIYNTAVGMLYAFAARIVKPANPKFKPTVVGVGILAFAASFIGFIKLVGTVYPVMGYLGFTIMAAIIVSWFRSRKHAEANEKIRIAG